MNLFLSETIYKSTNISVYGLATYCSIKSLLFDSDISEICISPEILSYQLIKKINHSRRFTNYITAGLEELISLGYISKVEEKNKYTVINCSNLFINSQEEHFTIISYDELLSIFSLKTNSSFSLLKYFILLMSTISFSIDVWLNNQDHKNHVVGNCTIDYLSYISAIPKRTIIEYNKILENIGILYIFRQNDFYLNDTTKDITRLTNIYGRPSDKIYIDAFAVNQKKYLNSYRYLENNISETNTKRKLAQMYIQLCKNKKTKYSIEEILNVYNYVLNENKKYQKLFEDTNDEKYKNKIRDTSIFDKFDFITRSDLY